MENDYLYGLTVQGIQSYIFSTNKLKEIIGASEIIEQLCTTWFDEFIKVNELKGKKYLNAAGNIRFKSDRETIQKIFTEYHEFLLKNASGVPFSQAVVKITGSDSEAIYCLDKKLNAQRNSPIYAFDLGIMIRSKARRTGDAATFKKDAEGDFTDINTGLKFTNADSKALETKTKVENVSYPSEFSEIAKEGKHSWLALVHIDGNGMGNRINDIINSEKENIFEELKTFSESIGKSTIEAYQCAIKAIIPLVDENYSKNKPIELPMRPIILGGDDLTVIIRADLALKFTEVFLNEFEKNTETKLGKDKGLTACAGIAFVKEKFPFHYSAHLAEELCGFAKDSGNRQASCLQFHRVQDSFIDTYKEIINRELTTEENTPFVFQNGPYYLDKSKGVSIESLIEDYKLLQNEDAPKNGMREWIDAKFNNPLMTETLMSRLITKAGDKSKYKDILNNTKAFMDYHTLLAINIQI